MSPKLRHAMDYLHTWTGVLFSALLFLVFFMGTLSVFDHEIDRWMMPVTRVAQPAAMSFDRIARPHLERLAPDARQWTVHYPSAREPAARLAWMAAGVPQSRYVDANTGALLADPGSKGGTGFFFPFHYSFHIKWLDLGYWLLGIISIGLLVLLVSGVIIHRKIFADFFAFRPGKSRQRAMLDLHNASAVLLLPFHFTITLTGLIIFLFIYAKPGIALVYGKDADKVTREAFSLAARGPAGRPGALAPVDAMARQAQALWDGGAVRRISVRNPGDANALVDIQRRPDDQISYDTRTLTFDGASGALLNQADLSPTAGLQRFLTGLHMLPFEHWWLRWVYFAMGLVSCVMMASGLLVWAEKRRARQEKMGHRSHLVVSAVAVAGSAGVVVATLAMLVANKLLPAGMAERALAEQYVFFAVWGGALLHALLRAFQWHPGRVIATAWREQASMAALLAVLAVVLNAVATGDHLLRTLARGDLAVAGVDLVLLATTALSVLVARRLGRRTAVIPVSEVVARKAAA